MDKILARKAFIQTLRNFGRIVPMILGISLFLALIISIVPQGEYIRAFTNIPSIDALIGAALGSISAGNPITSYIIGGELLKQEVGLIAVTAFILSWVTVGLIQLPAEISELGKKFAIARNLINFAGAIVIALLTALTLSLIR